VCHAATKTGNVAFAIHVALSSHWDFNERMLQVHLSGRNVRAIEADKKSSGIGSFILNFSRLQPNNSALATASRVGCHITANRDASFEKNINAI